MPTFAADVLPGELSSGYFAARVTRTDAAGPDGPAAGFILRNPGGSPDEWIGSLGPGASVVGSLFHPQSPNLSVSALGAVAGDGGGSTAPPPAPPAVQSAPLSGGPVGSPVTPPIPTLPAASSRPGERPWTAQDTAGVEKAIAESARAMIAAATEIAGDLEARISAAGEAVVEAQLSVGSRIVDRLAATRTSVAEADRALVNQLSEQLVTANTLAARAIAACPPGPLPIQYRPPDQRQMPPLPQEPAYDNRPPGPAAGQCVATVGPGGGVTVNVLPAAPPPAAINVLPAPLPAPIQQFGLVVTEDVRRVGPPVLRAPEGGICPTPDPPQWAVWKNAETCGVQITDYAAEAPGAGFTREGLFKGIDEAAVFATTLRREQTICQPPPEASKYSMPDQIWDSLDVCRAIDSAAGPRGRKGSVDFAQMMGLRDPAGRPTYYPELKKWEILGFPIGEFTGDVSRMVMDALSAPVNALLQSMGGGAAATVGPRAGNAIWELLAQYAGTDVSDIIRPDRYKIDYHNPTIIPTADSAIAAYLADQVGLETALCWARANGRLPTPWLAEVKAAAARHAPADAITLMRLGEFDRKEAMGEIRRNGWLGGEDFVRWERLTEQRPPMGDLVRMMVRDADDKDEVDAGDLDFQFGKKYQRQLRKWAEEQGIPEKVAKYYWRAHWQLPSPTQLYEMANRLSRLPVGDPRRVDLPEVEKTLRANDYAPRWIAPLMAIAKHPLTRTDARRAFDAGTLSADELLEVYRTLGYSEEDAQRLLKFAAHQRGRAALRLEEVRLYIQGAATRTDAEGALHAAGYEADTVKATLVEARRRRRNLSRSKCIKAVGRRMIRGEFDEQEAANRLMALGHDAEDANDMAAGWACERAALGKDLSASQLCAAFSQGLVQPDDYVRRLVRLGYDWGEAVVMAQMCDGAKRARDARAAQIAADKAAAARKRMAKEQRAADRAAATAADREASRVAKEREEQLARDGRFVRLVSATAKRMKVSPDSLMGAFGRVRQDLESRTGDPDFTLAVLSAAAAIWAGPGRQPGLGELADTFLRSPVSSGVGSR